MRTKISLYAVFILLLFIPNVFALAVSAQDSVQDAAKILNTDETYNKQELIVQVKDGVTDEAKQAIFQSVSAIEAASLTQGRFTLLSLPAGINLEAAAKRLLAHSEILTAELNYKIEQTYIPTDPEYSNQWYLKTLKLPASWDLPKGHASIKVAVIDGGVEVNHIDLKEKITKPYNIITRKKTLDANDHGTHIAGIIAASHNNEGITGIATTAKIIPVNVFRGDEADLFDVAEGIYYAVDAGADIINLSLTTEVYTSVLDEAVQAAVARGVLVIAAAGNEHAATRRYPAALKNVLAVSAIDKKDKLAGFSNFGKYIDFTAPGKDILSTVSGGGYDTMSGTSMASPMISGIAALVLAKNPFLTPDEVTSILKESSEDLGPEGWDPQYGYGKVDAYRALENTIEPLSPIELSETSYTVDGTNRVKISFKPTKGTTVSLHIKDSKGKVHKTLLSNKSSTGDLITYSWGGKLDNGSFLSSGDYTLVAKTANARHSLSKTKALPVKNTMIPELAYTKSAYLYSPTATVKLAIPFQLNKDATIKAVILDSTGKKVRTLQKNNHFIGGKQSIEWNGTDAARSLLGDGSYTLNISLVDSDGVTGTTKTIPITLDTKAPDASIVNSDSSFKVTGKTKMKTTITVKEAVTSSVSIIDDNGKIIKRLVTSIPYKIGPTSVSWNGQNENKIAVKNGSYRFKIILTDAAGNKKILKSSSFKLIHA